VVFGWGDEAVMADDYYDIEFNGYTVKGRIASRFIEDNIKEKCPKCLQIGVNFYEMTPVTLACLSCGCVFVRSTFRKTLDIKGLLKKADEDKRAQCSFCGEVLKNRTGKFVHEKRFCWKNPDSEINKAKNGKIEDK